MGRASDGLAGEATEAFAIAANDSKILYVWVLGNGLYRSKDAAASWQRVDDGPTQQEIRSLASVGTTTGMGGIWLYAGLDTGIVRSPDCFCGWDPLPNVGLPERSRVYSLAASPADPKIVFAGMRQGVFKTIDGGQSWIRATDHIADAIVTVNPAKPSEVYAVGADGTLIASKDAGVTWMRVGQREGRLGPG